MKNQLAARINAARRVGVNHGIEFMAGLILLALNNVADDYIEEKRLNAFFKDTEKELNRLYQEVINSVPFGEVTEMAERASSRLKVWEHLRK